MKKYVIRIVGGTLVGGMGALIAQDPQEKPAVPVVAPSVFEDLVLPPEIQRDLELLGDGKAVENKLEKKKSKKKKGKKNKKDKKKKKDKKAKKSKDGKKKKKSKGGKSKKSAEFEDEREESLPTHEWCDALRDFGEIYKKKSNPFIQEVELTGRAHYQWGHTDGDFNGRSFSGQGDELRRFRFGAKVRFLDHLELKAGVRLSRGDFRQSEVGYDELDLLNLTYKFGDVGSFEKMSLGYGRYKFAVTGELQMSSNDIKTIERSNLSNFFGRGRATGVRLQASRWDTDFTLGVLSPEDDPDLSRWDGGRAFYASADVDLGKKKNLILDFLYVDAEGDDDTLFGYDWVASATYLTEIGNWEIMANAVYGDTGEEEVYGFVFIPSTFLIKDRLELVFRYQWAAASGDVLEMNRRNVRNVGRRELPRVRNVRGDESHSVYAGLNYHFCEDNMKLMLGAEYEEISSRTNDLEATTVWASLRVRF